MMIQFYAEISVSAAGTGTLNKGKWPHSLACCYRFEQIRHLTYIQIHVHIACKSPLVASGDTTASKEPRRQKSNRTSCLPSIYLNFTNQTIKMVY